jgi:hypothetical protein
MLGSKSHIVVKIYFLTLHLLLQIRQVVLQELLPLSAAQGAHHLVEPTAIIRVAAVQRILLRKALASEMCGSVLRACVHVSCVFVQNASVYAVMLCNSYMKQRIQELQQLNFCIFVSGI